MLTEPARILGCKQPLLIIGFILTVAGAPAALAATALSEQPPESPSIAEPAVGTPDKEANDQQSGDENPSEIKPGDPGWMDNSHLFVTNQSDNLVRWLDSFLGTPRADLESAQSFLRVRMDHQWDQEDGNDLGFRVRGRVRLPRISERIGLIFSDERGDETGQGESATQALSNGDSKNDVALQYTGIDKDRSRLDFKLGFRSGLRIKLAARYRYEQPLSDSMVGRFTEELYFRDGRGFGTFTRFDLDKTLANSNILRWSNRFEWGQETRGVEWGTSLLLAYKVSDRSAVSYFINAEGDTRPNELTRSYGLGATYRRNFLRKWLFFELEPAYHWRRNYREDMPAFGPYYTDRDGVARFTARLEVMFGTDQL